jgi:tripartite-type tricarboxylate transporter receptor subunit TctC
MAIVALLATVPLATFTRAASAQDAQGYPDKPIHLIVPYEPGGGTDIFGRLVGKELAVKLGQSVIIENRAGAGGAVGTASVIHSAADGYTLELVSTSPVTVQPFIRKHLGYDPIKDLAPITLIASIPAVLVVSPTLPVNSVADLVKYAKANPGKLTFSSSGIGGTAHLSGEMLKTMTGTDMLHVPYKGTGPALTGVLSGEVSMTFGDVVSTLKFVQSGQMKALGVTTPKRSPVLPDVPSIAETLPGYSSGVWYGIVAPAKTPPAIVDKLNKALVEILKDPEFKKTLNEQGAEPIGNTPAEFVAFIKDDMDRWGKLIKEAGIPAE